MNNWKGPKYEEKINFFSFFKKREKLKKKRKNKIKERPVYLDSTVFVEESALR